MYVTYQEVMELPSTSSLVNYTVWFEADSWIEESARARSKTTLRVVCPQPTTNNDQRKAAKPSTAIHYVVWSVREALH